jgi:D-alanyl-D-alanine carboxypeptidase
VTATATATMRPTARRMAWWGGNVAGMTGLIGASARRAAGLLIAILAGLSLVVPAVADAAFLKPRYAAIVMDARTGEVLYANAADEARHPASITKVMTLFLAFDALVAGRLRLSDPITMSRHAASQRPSKLGLAPGRSISLDDAIHIITVKSANDVAVALGERIGGSEPAFAQMMTRKARALGMRNTTFTNATGLPDPGNVTTARDIAILSSALLKQHPSYYTYFGQQAFKYDSRSYTNHNRLLGKLTGLDGIKTGFTNDSGYTLAASAVRNGQRLITVVLGEPSIPARNRDVTALLEAGFNVLDRRRQGEETTVAFNLPELNHPALRLANPAEMGSRPDPATFRRQLALDASAFSRQAAEEREADDRVAVTLAPRAPAPAKGARATRTAAVAKPARSASSGRNTHVTKASAKVERRKAEREELAASGRKSRGKAKPERSAKNEAASGTRGKSAKASESASASSRTTGKAKTVRTADATERKASPVADWNAKFKSQRSANP